MKKRYLYAAIIAVLAVGAGLGVYYAAQDVIRDALVRGYQVVYMVASAIPPPLYWGFLILVIVVNAIRSLFGDEGQRPRPGLGPAGGRAAEWREWLKRTDGPASSRPFYRWLVARNLAKLDSEVVAYQRGITPGEVEREMEDGDLPLPAGLRDYFLTSMRSRPTRSSAWFRRAGTPAAGPLDLDPTQAVQLIETQMEVSNDD